jgi:uncharacterized protein
MNMDSEPVTRWHEEPLAWFVLGIPLATIGACALLYAIASRNSDSLVVDDYYKRGLEINKVLDRQAHAAELGLTLQVTALRTGTLELVIGADTALWPDTLDIRLAHATRGEDDQHLAARHAGNGRYVATPPGLAPGPWYVDAATPEWRLVTRVMVRAD